MVLTVVQGKRIISQEFFFVLRSIDYREIHHYMGISVFKHPLFSLYKIKIDI